MSRVSEATIAYLARPTTRIEQHPLPELSEQELLALLIGGAFATSDAGLLLEAIGGNLKLLYMATLDELAGYSGIGYATAKRIKAALELGRRLTTPEARDQFATCSQAGTYFIRQGLGLCEQEEMWAASLDIKNRVLLLSKIYRGNVNSSIIRAAEVLRDPIRLTARALVIAHNHPSGDPTPSPEDVQVTRSIFEAAAILDIELLDHIVVGGEQWVSLKERGLGFG